MTNIIAARYPNAIAPRYAPSLDSAFPMAGMKTVEEVRRERLAMLRQEAGSLVALNERLGLNARDATLSQILNAAKNSRTGTPKQMGSKLARDLEAACEKEPGWMDTDPALMSAGWPFDLVDVEEILSLDEHGRGIVEGAILAALDRLREPPSAADMEVFRQSHVTVKKRATKRRAA